ncbi:MAG: hypothetical protein ABI680_03140, partial [Chthoniobacteraceae bacterium]
GLMSFCEVEEAELLIVARSNLSNALEHTALVERRQRTRGFGSVCRSVCFLGLKARSDGSDVDEVTAVSWVVLEIGDDLGRDLRDFHGFNAASEIGEKCPKRVGNV